jgi:HSP20 family protein
MTKVFVYEPFYDLERIFNAACTPQCAANAGPNAGLCRSDAVVRPNKPRQVPKLSAAVNILITSHFRMDLHEDNEKNLVTASFEFPGLSKEDIQIEVQHKKLTVSAETKEMTEHNYGGYAVRERRFGKFSRTLQLPQGIKVSFHASMSEPRVGSLQ